MFRPETLARLERARTACKQRGITQAKIAEDLGASQSQISRILAGEISRDSRLAEEVCLYVEQFSGGVNADAVRKNDDLIEALAQTWDGSAKHARALSTVIRSLAALGTCSGRPTRPLP
jgi:transcriptional regulator with XRE-family HTH domain